MRAKALEPVTLVRSPILTNSEEESIFTGSRPESIMDGKIGDIGTAHLGEN
jgi:hypothetical protein